MTEITVPDPDASPDERIETLIAITRALADIFETENLALFERSAGDLAPLQPVKARLAAAYAQSVRLVAADRRAAIGAPEALLSDLREATEAFTARAARQRALLEGHGLAGA